MRLMHIIKLPDGSTVQSLGIKTQEFWQRAGVEPRSDLTKLKGGHSKRVLALAAELYPDQVKTQESL